MDWVWNLDLHITARGSTKRLVIGNYLSASFHYKNVAVKSSEDKMSNFTMENTNAANGQSRLMLNSLQQRWR